MPLCGMRQRPQWKEDWKFHKNRKNFFQKSRASMKRGLKGALMSHLPMPSRFCLNEKRIERKLCDLLHLDFFPGLNEKRIESHRRARFCLPQYKLASMKRGLKVWITEVYIPTRIILPQWKEDWKTLAFTTCSSLICLTPQWKEDWKMSLLSLSSTGMESLNEKRIERK